MSVSSSVRTQMWAYNAVKYSWVAAATVMIYDYGLTITHEVRVPKSFRGGVVSHLLPITEIYMAATVHLREIPLSFRLFSAIFDISSEHFVVISYLVEVSQTNTIAAILAAQASIPFTKLQVQKVYAVYERNVKLLILLSIIIGLGVLTSILLLSFHKPIVFGMHFGLTGCGVDTLPRGFWFGALPSLILETILCFLMILKAIQHHRNGYISPLLTQMLKDSVYALEGRELAPVAILWESTIACTLGCRLLVNIMEYRQTANSPDWSEHHIMTPLDESSGSRQRSSGH
ncbi:hypothetical protein BU17DRAFT_60029 [Hysterangium stoloniferum]|nr:hypothetical protein BU17DRAFT_60029 [Hysterangium stoloniferum]